MKQSIIEELAIQFATATQDADGVEFLFARDLQGLLGYSQWRNFIPVLDKAKVACEKSGQNCDPRKEQIAFAMNYFAVQTRKQELLEERINQWERIQAREKLTVLERQFSGIIYQHDVDDQGFARIRSKGDEALFGGHATSRIKAKLKVPPDRALADFLPTITIKAKDFALEITNHNVQNKNLNGERDITHEHINNNLGVRKLLKESGIKPELLSAAEDLGKVKRRLESEHKALGKKAVKLPRTTD